ncbi:MAG: glycine betaine ABC transporter substrate-binding protein [Rhodococcus sp. (in: high G+C Gram-positive bacteria)]
MRVSLMTRAVVAGAVSVTALSGCSSATGPDTGPTRSSLIVADTGSPVQSVLAHVYAGALQRSGAEVSVSSVDGFDAALTGLDDASISMVPGFTGSLLTRFDPGSAAREPDEVYSALARALPEWLSLTDQGLAENGPTVSVTESVGSALSEATLSALSPRCDGLSARIESGAALDEVPAALAEVYGCRFAAAGPAADPEVTVVTATDRVPNTDAAEVVLSDDDDAFRADVVVPLFRKGVVGDDRSRSLQIVAGELTTADLAEMVDRVRAGDDSARVAEDWLSGLTF